MSAAAALARNEARLLELERRAAGYAEAGEDELAAAWCQIAGEFAWLAHTGHMARPGLDATIEAIGLRHCPRGTPTGPEGPERVLHVLTEVASTGGHSRLAWRWIERDIARVPTVALTCQRAAIPSRLEDAVAVRGGTIEQPGGGDLIARARALAALADRHDLVVLHVHPSDVVSGLALADRRGRPPVLLVNHADHCFWLGPGVADLVVNTRPAAARLATRRRGIAAGRTALLPVPTDLSERGRERARARALLGLDPGAVLMTVVAGAYKTRPIDGEGLLDVLVPAVEALPGVVVLAAGAQDSGDWERARLRTGGRIRALGLVEDLSTLREAADVHLDSFPCSSQTSALEAGAVGVPIVSYQPRRAAAGTYDLDDPALAGVHRRASTPREYRDVLAALAGDAAAREELGRRTMRAVRAEYDPARWCELLDGAYARARALAGTGGPAPTPIGHGPDDAAEDAFLQVLHGATGLVREPADAIARSHDAFPADPAKGLSIVIHARDDAERLLPMLRSAVETTDHLEQVEAIVVDDGSTDGTPALLRRLDGDLRVMRNPRPRGAHASFADGVAVAAGPAVLLVSADITLEPGWCDAMAAALARPGVSAVSPSVVPAADPGAAGVVSEPVTSARGVCFLTSAAAVREGIGLVLAHEPAARVSRGRTAHAPAPAPAG